MDHDSEQHHMKMAGGAGMAAGGLMGWAMGMMSGAMIGFVVGLWTGLMIRGRPKHG